MVKQSWVGFSGGRFLPDTWVPYIQGLVARAHKAGYRIVTGCATGADRMVVQACIAQGIPVVVMCAHEIAPLQSKLPAGSRVVAWAGGGAQVPVVQRLRGRTIRMVQGLAKSPGSVLVALPGGPGTSLAVRVARSLRVRVAGPGASSPSSSVGGDPPAPGEWFDEFEADPQAFRPDRYLISKAQVLPGGKLPGSKPLFNGKMPRKRRVRKARKLSYKPHLIFTCGCGWVKQLYVQGACTCWLCGEGHSVMPVAFRDELYLKARSLVDHPLDTERSLSDDTQALGWPEEAGTSNDPLDRTQLGYNERAGFHIVNHDLWGEWSGYDSQID